MGSKCSSTRQYTALFRPFPPCLASTRNFFNSLLVKKNDGQAKAWVIPTKNHTVMMPDNHWWQPMIPCKEFGPTKLNGLIDEEAPIKCHDNSVPEWWTDKWQWSIDGENFSGQVDDMEPAIGVVEHGYFVLGKRT
jgi:hypothetical protein